MSYNVYKHTFKNGESLFSMTDFTEKAVEYNLLAFSEKDEKATKDKRMYYLISQGEINKRLIHFPCKILGAPKNNLIEIHWKDEFVTLSIPKDELIFEDKSKRTLGFDGDKEIKDEFFRRLKDK